VIQEGQWFKSSHAELGCHAVKFFNTELIDSVRPHNCEKYISEELRKRRRWKAKSKKKSRWTARLNFDSSTLKWCQIKMYSKTVICKNI
jgi:hypothetical protein